MFACCQQQRTCLKEKCNVHKKEKQVFTSSNKPPPFHKTWEWKEEVSLKHGSGMTYLNVCGSTPHNKKFNVLKRRTTKTRHRWELAAVWALLRVGRGGMGKGKAMLEVLLLTWVWAETERWNVKNLWNLDSHWRRRRFFYCLKCFTCTNVKDN